MRLFFSSEQRSEFIYHLLRLLCVGGSMHQREEYSTQYFDTTRKLYKDLMTVHKSAKTGNIEITSRVFQLVPSAPSPLFPNDTPHHRCYLIVDPLKRYATLL